MEKFPQVNREGEDHGSLMWEKLAPPMGPRGDLPLTGLPSPSLQLSTLQVQLQLGLFRALNLDCLKTIFVSHHCHSVIFGTG